MALGPVVGFTVKTNNLNVIPRFLRMNNTSSPMDTLLTLVQAVELCGAGQCTFVHVQSPGRLGRTHRYTGVGMQGRVM